MWLPELTLPGERMCVAIVSSYQCRESNAKILFADKLSCRYRCIDVGDEMELSLNLVDA